MTKPEERVEIGDGYGDIITSDKENENRNRETLTKM
jgi:hypothetical protein